MYDPFVASDPPVLVHEVDGPVFERAWHGFDSADADIVCPVCGQGHPKERDTSPRSSRPWIRFSCGDVVAQEVTAG